MADMKYIATADGYVNGKVVKAGEAFVADFREVVRDESQTPIQKRRLARDGEELAPAVYPIKRDKDGNAVLGKVKVPSWAAPADAKAFAAQEAASGVFQDPVFEDMSKDALVAYLASNNIPHDPKGSKASLVAAAHAETNYQT